MWHGSILDAKPARKGITVTDELSAGGSSIQPKPGCRHRASPPMAGVYL
jgi:hypothetical protein